jgi:hypothetical protein
MIGDAIALINELENRRYRALCEADVRALDELLDEKLIYVHATGARDTKATYLEGIRSRKWVFRRLERAEDEVLLHGSCAVMIGRLTVDLDVNGVARALNNRFTNVWVNGNSGWRMVAWQSATVAP